MSKTVYIEGNLRIEVQNPDLACAPPPDFDYVEVWATGISTLDGQRKCLALLVPTQACATPAALAAYVAHNAYLVP